MGGDECCPMSCLNLLQLILNDKMLFVASFSKEQDPVEERPDHHITEDGQDVEGCQEVQTQVSTTNWGGVK